MSGLLRKFFFYPARKEFWYAQTFAWVGDFCINFILDYFFRDTDIRLVIFADLFMLFTGFIITYLYRQVMVHFNLVARDLKKTIITVAFSTVTLSCILTGFNILYLYLYHVYFDPLGTHYTFRLSLILFLRLYNLWQLFCLAWMVAYFGYHFFQNYRLSEIERWKYYSKASEARLIALRAQIQPHFLFNCLNNIYSLTTENSHKAKSMIQHLSGLLRKSMKFTEKNAVKISEELDMVNDYMQLQSIQFEDKLQFIVQAEDAVLDIMIPPLTLQVLIENAIVHGIEKNAGRGNVVMKIELKEKALFINVFNSGKINGAFVPGTGLSNILSRLKMLYGENVTLNLHEGMGENTVCASLTLPDISLYQRKDLPMVASNDH